ncbi:phage major capsid protein [Yunchengibacter salinarum]|uniref:phage major capsid protein n=1 Tax=Yunchengibacter salinarum TaxID=3133399 RepID=UPI0035B63BAD
MDLTDLKQAVDGYAETATEGLDSLKSRLDTLETRLDRPDAAPERPAGTGTAAEHKAAFLEGFLAKGDDSRIRALEHKALSTSTGGDGGYAVPEEIDHAIEKQLVDLSPLRRHVTVRTVTSGDYKRLVNTGGAGSGWVGEADGRSQTATPNLEEVAITPGELYANAAATQRALDDMQFDAEGWLLEEVTEEFAVQENAAIINGDGINKPRGILTAPMSTSGDDTRPFGTLQVLPTGVDGGFASADPADILVDLVHSLKPRYRQGAVFLMNSKTLAVVRKFKDGDGNFIWRPGLADGQPDRLLGHPVVECEDMPDIASDSLSIAFGNLGRAYTLAERTGTRVLRDPYSNKPYVHFYATRRVGGALVNDQALKLVRFSLA